MEKNRKTPNRRSKTNFISGISEASKKLEYYIKLVAPTRMSVLISGDSGTGKEYVAQQIHRLSTRKYEPFVTMDCSVASGETHSSVIFKPPSTTGKEQKGDVELANGGTLFLDGISHLNDDLQRELLQTLKGSKTKAIGPGEKAIKLDLRIIATANENLEKVVEEGALREDLFSYLNEFSIDIPPLKNRSDDLIIFLDHFLEIANEEFHKEVIGFSEEVLDIFHQYSWPGNLRELKNHIKRAVLLAQTNIITKSELPEKLYTATALQKVNYKNSFQKKNHFTIL